MTLIIIILLLTGVIIPLYIYLTLQDLKYFLIVLLITVLVLVYLYWRFNEFDKKQRRKNFMFALIELFILNFDVQKSVDATLPTIFPLLPSNKEKKYLAIQKEFSGINFLEQLRSYFVHHYYESFIDLVKVVTERGGNIIKVSEVLLAALSENESRSLKLKRLNDSFLVKFSFSWIFIMVIGIVFRYALAAFLSFDNLPIIYISGNLIFVAVYLFGLTILLESIVRKGTREP